MKIILILFFFSLQHSASTTMSSNAAVGSQKPAPIGSGGSSSYGPIGSTTFSQAAPGPPFPSGNVNAQPQSKLTCYFNDPILAILSRLNSGRFIFSYLFYEEIGFKKGIKI